MQRCIVTLWTLVAACRSGDVGERDAAAAAAAAALATRCAAHGPLRLAVVAGVMAMDTAAFGVDAIAAAHGLAATWRAAGVAEVRPHERVTADELAGWARAMVAAGDDPAQRRALAALPGVEVVQLDLTTDGDDPPRPLQRGGHGAAAPDSALRSVYVQHRLIAGLPTLPGVPPATAKAVVQMVVERLLALPGGLEPLMLLQRDSGLLPSSIRVAVLAVLAARAAGWPDERLADVGAAALLHDLGSILDEARPGPAAFTWLLERGADDFWLRCALVARRWREQHGNLVEAGNDGQGVAALVRMAAELERCLRAGAPGALRPRLGQLAAAGAFPAELIEALPAGIV